jgi:DNA polymerase I-like protein with 3'-5' exonuclease and polymerase domains
MPTGRVYDFEPVLRRGEYIWPVTDICNYPVQGFAADLMSIVRVNLNTILSQMPYIYLWGNTVHDSILLDVDNARDTWYNVCRAVKTAFENTAENYELLFNEPLLVPMACDVKVGINWLWMHKLKFKE